MTETKSSNEIVLTRQGKRITGEFSDAKMTIRQEQYCDYCWIHRKLDAAPQVKFAELHRATHEKKMKNASIRIDGLETWSGDARVAWENESKPPDLSQFLKLGSEILVKPYPWRSYIFTMDGVLVLTRGTHRHANGVTDEFLKAIRDALATEERLGLGL